MKIREAKQKDLVILWKFEKLHYTFDKTILPKYFHQQILRGKNVKKEFYKHTKKFFTNPNYCVLIAEINKKPIGTIQGYVKKTWLYKYKVGYVDNLFVIKEFRGKGIAIKLRNELWKWFRSKKLKYLSVDVFYFNKHAREIYKKWGFKPYTLHLKKTLK